MRLVHQEDEEALLSMSELEISEMDQGRFLCPACKTFFTPQGEYGHLGCPVE